MDHIWMKLLDNLLDGLIHFWNIVAVTEVWQVDAFQFDWSIALFADAKVWGDGIFFTAKNQDFMASSFQGPGQCLSVDLRPRIVERWVPVNDQKNAESSPVFAKDGLA